MNFQDFEEEFRQRAIVETIYDDTEGRRILVACVLDVFVAFNKMLKEEREACAKVCDSYDSADPLGVSLECAAAIRARGTNAA